jgi:transcriptional regulator with XRE-family HTH domain
MQPPNMQTTDVGMAAKRVRRRRRPGVFIAHPDAATNPEIGRRLKLLRKYLKLKQLEMAKRVGVTAPAWNHYERGENAPDWRVAVRIALTCGAKESWIYRGDPCGLSRTIRKRLAALDRELEADGDDAVA